MPFHKIVLPECERCGATPWVGDVADTWPSTLTEARKLIEIRADHYMPGFALFDNEPYCSECAGEVVFERRFKETDKALYEGEVWNFDGYAWYDDIDQRWLVPLNRKLDEECGECHRPLPNSGGWDYAEAPLDEVKPA